MAPFVASKLSHLGLAGLERCLETVFEDLAWLLLLLFLLLELLEELFFDETIFAGEVFNKEDTDPEPALEDVWMNSGMSTFLISSHGNKDK